ncbi:hypothetical protein AN2351V1_0717, partial [Citrobacter koseri]
VTYFSDIDLYQLVYDENISALSDFLYSHDISINEKYLGDSLLHIAASKGKIRVCKYLVDKGINVNSIDDHYLTPLVESAREGHLDVLCFLLEVGAWSDGDPRGITTPLIEASLGGHPEIVKILLKYKVNINRLQTKLNCTALDISIAYGHEHIASILVCNGARKLLEVIELKNINGSGILSHIYDNAGVIITDEYIRGNVSIKTSLIGKRKQYINNKILFTFGSFVKKPCREFLICLPYGWPINVQIFSGDYREAFPLKFLFLLSELYKNGMDVKEGSILEKQDIIWSQLKWPENIDALVAVDYSFDHQEKEQNLEGETVDLLLFIPIKYPKSGRPKEDKLNQWITKRRIAKWNSVSFKNEWLSPV